MLGEEDRARRIFQPNAASAIPTFARAETIGRLGLNGSYGSEMKTTTSPTQCPDAVKSNLSTHAPHLVHSWRGVIADSLTYSSSARGASLPHIHLLHLSDLHYSASAEDDRRLQTLLADVNQTLGRSSAHVCFSGDLTYGGTEQEFRFLYQNFIFNLKGYDRLFMCPGNHDVVRQHTSQEEVIKAIKTSDGLQAFDGIVSPFSKRCPLSDYMATQEALCDFTTNNFYASMGGTDNLQIVSINTAWTSFKRPDNYTDKGNLQINQRAVDQAVAALQADKVKILMMHHPISWLNSPSQKYLQQISSRHFDFVISGHEHDPISSAIESPHGKCIFIEATAAKADWCQGLNGYSLISLDPASLAVQVSHRSYSPARSTFIDGDGIAEGGKYYPRDSDRAYWIRELANDTQFIIGKCASQLNIKTLTSSLESAYSSKYQSALRPVITKFSQVKFKDGEREKSGKTPVTDCIDSISSTAFFVGPKDSGLTVASQIAFRHIAESLERFSAIPIYINVEDISSINKAALHREIQRGFVTRLTQAETNTLSETGSVYFLFDGICIHDIAKLSAIRNVLTTYFGKCKAAIFCSLDRRTSSKEEEGVVDFDPNFDTVYEVCQLDSIEIKDMIDKKAVDQPALVKENLLNNTVISFKAMDEPVYATTVSLLVDTLKQLPDYKPINRVRLLDRYIECLLGRYTLEDVQVGRFNSSEKSNLLSFIAGKMVTMRKIHLRKSELDQIVSQYTEEMLLEVPKDILNEFVIKGILFASGEFITFRANSMFSYFVAKEMVRNKEIFQTITSEDCFFSYHNEIVFYGELEGVDNSGLLNSAEVYVSEFADLIIAQYKENGIDFKNEWTKMVLPSVDDQPQLASTIEAIASQVPSEADKVNSRSSDLAAERRLRGVSSRSTVKEMEAKWLIVIRVYLQLLKHSSSIGGPDKIRHLRVALNALESLAQSLAVKREQISTSPAFSHGGILYLNPMAALDLERSKREFRINANASVAEMASEMMGTSQLGLALSRVAHDTSEFQSFIIRNLLMDIPSSDNSDYVINSVANSRIPALQIASLRSLKEKYVSYKTSEGERRHQKSIIDGLNRQRNIHRQLNITQIERRLSLAKIQNPEAFKSSGKVKTKTKRPKKR